MSLFDKDLIEKDIPPLTLKEQFAFDLMDKINIHHRDLINTQRVRGYEGVLFCLHMYILSLQRITIDPEKMFLKYGNLRIDPTKNGWVTHYKGEYYITIPTDGYIMNRQLDGSLTGANWKEYGEIIISLDKYLRIKYYKVLEYNHGWREDEFI